MAEPGESYVIMEDNDILRYVKNGVDSYEGVKRFVKVGNVSSFKLRLNPSNELSSSITLYH